MKIKTSELTGVALDWAVATCEGATDLWFDTVATYWVKLNGEDRALRYGWAGMSYLPSTDWAQGGPIIEREKIDLFTEKQTYPESWCASIARYQNGHRLVGWRLHQYGPTPLIAAMRCFVASKLGDEVEIPTDLL